MKTIGRYDSNLHMFVEETHEPDLRRLMFLRWLVENNRMERPVVGPATGDLAMLTDYTRG
jgi:hypothetical protein